MKVSNDFLLKASLLLVVSVLIHYFLFTNFNGTENRYHQYRGFEQMQLLNSTQPNSDERWIFMMTILSTLFAIFFVYSGFKIDSTREKVDEAEKRIIEAERKINEDILEYGNQLQYAISFMLTKQYSKAIDALTVLRSEPFVLKDDNKINTCNFYLANCYYEKGLLEDNKEDIAIAVEYIDQALVAEDHPFKLEIINTFTKMDSEK